MSVQKVVDKLQQLDIEHAKANGGPVVKINHLMQSIQLGWNWKIDDLNQSISDAIEQGLITRYSPDRLQIWYSLS